MGGGHSPELDNNGSKFCIVKHNGNFWTLKVVSLRLKGCSVCAFFFI